MIFDTGITAEILGGPDVDTLLRSMKIDWLKDSPSVNILEFSIQITTEEEVEKICIFIETIGRQSDDGNIILNASIIRDGVGQHGQKVYMLYNSKTRKGNMLFL